jgi:ketosteroid isomerase-like protein
MRTLTLLTLLLLSLALPVCGQAKPENNANRVAKGSTADALMDEWVSSWNRDEAAYIENSLAPDAVVLHGSGTPLKGKAAAGKDFVRKELPLVSNLVVKAMDSGMSTDLAYQTGSYTQRIDKPQGGGQPSTQTGRYTFVWRKLPGSVFKLKSVLMVPDAAPRQ